MKYILKWCEVCKKWTKHYKDKCVVCLEKLKELCPESFGL